MNDPRLQTYVEDIVNITQQAMQKTSLVPLVFIVVDDPIGGINMILIPDSFMAFASQENRDQLIQDMSIDVLKKVNRHSPDAKLLAVIAVHDAWYNTKWTKTKEESRQYAREMREGKQIRPTDDPDRMEGVAVVVAEKDLCTCFLYGYKRIDGETVFTPIISVYATPTEDEKVSVVSIMSNIFPEKLK